MIGPSSMRICSIGR